MGPVVVAECETAEPDLGCWLAELGPWRRPMAPPRWLASVPGLARARQDQDHVG